MAGAYLFAWGATALGAVSLLRFGMPGSEAVMAVSMLSYPLYVGAGLWAVAQPRLLLVMVTLVGGGALMLVISAQWPRGLA